MTRIIDLPKSMYTIREIPPTRSQVIKTIATIAVIVIVFAIGG